MIERVTVWNKSGENLEVKFKLIISYKNVSLYDEHAETFLAWKAEETDRELVIELTKWEDEED
ncbi:MAG: hypothetical protein OBKJMPBA_00014 [Methanophagales virus PBV304]|uniref:Uncharacterized protein n=1 Tax=Methanophagales virus PBV304 TaxID=3071309 RepID=A0AA46TDJ8_9VIRU|nr:MAG: hypothetical protein QIT47_gp14 [Methanophagales virus PBV304]UYL65046.1 MAG: hypothetical protein OBKJMPBA_00014 [Methanophagales virus PBV304]